MNKIEIQNAMVAWVAITTHLLKNGGNQLEMRDIVKDIDAPWIQNLFPTPETK